MKHLELKCAFNAFITNVYLPILTHDDLWLYCRIFWAEPTLIFFFSYETKKSSQQKVIV